MTGTSSPRWRPEPRIRLKAIALPIDKDRLLVCEVLDDSGKVKGWCPLGGGVEFGETAETALRREIQEELDCGLTVEDKPIVFENIFEHHGAVGHEIVFAYRIRLDGSAIHQRERFQIVEDSGSAHWVEWIGLAHFRNGEETLFPSALLQYVE